MRKRSIETEHLVFEIIQNTGRTDTHQIRSKLIDISREQIQAALMSLRNDKKIKLIGIRKKKNCPGSIIPTIRLNIYEVC